MCVCGAYVCVCGVCTYVCMCVCGVCVCVCVCDLAAFLVLPGWTIDNTGAVLYTFEHIDYEELWYNHSTDMYTMNLRVVDLNTERGIVNFCELSICIQVTDVNDNPPVWTQPSYNISSCISEVCSFIQGIMCTVQYCRCTIIILVYLLVCCVHLVCACVQQIKPTSQRSHRC